MTGRDLPAAYGGSGWVPRPAALAEEMGTLWGAWGVDTEVGPLEAVLMHAPGPEMDGLANADAALMLEKVSPAAMRQEHQSLRALYEQAGVQVHLVEPGTAIPPNAIFCRDLFFMTPEGAILARPAGRMRAGEERFIQARLAALGVPILLSVRGNGTFEGADALWLDRETVLLATGLRTNEAGADQVQGLLCSMGVHVVRVDLSYGSLHLLGVVNLAGPDLAIAWPWRVPHRAVEALRASGFRVFFLPDETEAAQGMALNFVPLEPYRIIMPAGCPRTRAFYESLGIVCLEAGIDAIRQAAGGMGCLTGILKRKRPHI